MRKFQNSESIADAFTLSAEQAKTRYNCGVYTIDHLAEEAGAIIHIGRRKLYLKERLDSYMLNIASK